MIFFRLFNGDNNYMYEEKIKYGHKNLINSKGMDTQKNRHCSGLKGIDSQKINFYRSPDELPEEISAENYKKIFKKKPRLNKHRKTVYNGVKYHSGWEAKYAEELDLLKLSGEIKEWERQSKIEINVIEENNKAVLTDMPMLKLKEEGKSFTHICNYYIDFVLTHKDGTLEYVEIKGVQMELWKLKFRLFESIFKIIHPEIKITVIK